MYFVHPIEQVRIVMMTDISIPIELLEQFERSNVMLFVGEGMNQGVLPSSAELIEGLATRCDYPSEEPLTLPRVAGYYEMTRGRHGLVQFLRDQLDSLPRPLRTHRLLIQLRPRVIVTTCYDRLLEHALREADIPYTVVVGNAEVAYAEEGKMLLVWLWGVLDQPDSIVVTEDDRRLFLEGRANLSDVLRGELARRTWVFIGFDAEDEWFRNFYDQVNRGLDRQSRRAYICGGTPGAYTQAWWERRNAEILTVEVEPFLTVLTERLAARARPQVSTTGPVEEPAAPLPERPYKFLDYYESKDAAIFFGRQDETQTLSSLIHAHRLVLLYGASGVGKTSLLLAGAIPRLEHAEPPYETLYVRALEDPALVIRRALRRRLPEANLPQDGSLADLLDSAAKALGHTLVIILDQFEEFFIRLSPESRSVFIAGLGALYDARDVPVKVVLSLREDWLASMSEIEERIPEVFRTRMRLLPLTHDQARQAITAPVERLGVRYEPALVKRLLDDLMGAEGTAVMPPQLQLICSMLYAEMKPGEHLITLAAYQRLGSAHGVLQRYLNDELARLGSDERALARAVLGELVTSQGTKAVKDRDELAVALDADVSIVQLVLEKLVRARLLRVLERQDGETAYELTHEYLIRQIDVAAEVRARKQIEELIHQEVENWQRFGTLLAADKLALIGEVRDALRLNDAAQELLLRSALQVGYEVDYWLSRVGDPERRVALLTEVARGKSTVIQQGGIHKPNIRPVVPPQGPYAPVRRRTALALATQDVPGAVSPLLRLALHDPDPSVRTTAQESLVRLTEQRALVVARLRSEIERADRQARRSALEILVMLPLRDLPSDLRVQAITTNTAFTTRLLVGRLGSYIQRNRWLLQMTTLSATLLLIMVLLALSPTSDPPFVLVTHTFHDLETVDVAVPRVTASAAWPTLDPKVATRAIAQAAATTAAKATLEAQATADTLGALCDEITQYTLSVESNPALDPPANTARVIGGSYPEARATWVITNTSSECPWLDVRLRPAMEGAVVTPRLVRNDRPVDRVEPGESVIVELAFDAFAESIDQTWYLVVVSPSGDLALIDQPALRLEAKPWVQSVSPTPTAANRPQPTDRPRP